MTFTRRSFFAAAFGAVCAALGVRKAEPLVGEEIEDYALWSYEEPIKSAPSAPQWKIYGGSVKIDCGPIDVTDYTGVNKYMLGIRNGRT